MLLGVQDSAPAFGSDQMDFFLHEAKKPYKQIPNESCSKHASNRSKRVVTVETCRTSGSQGHNKKTLTFFWHSQSTNQEKAAKSGGKSGAVSDR